MKKEIQIPLKQEVEVVNKVEDPELTDMIHRFDYIPTSDLCLSVNDHLKIYNWLRELELYHELCGSINKI